MYTFVRWTGCMYPVHIYVFRCCCCCCCLPEETRNASIVLCALSLSHSGSDSYSSWNIMAKHHRKKKYTANTSRAEQQRQNGSFLLLDELCVPVGLNRSCYVLWPVLCLCDFPNSIPFQFNALNEKSTNCIHTAIQCAYNSICSFVRSFVRLLMRQRWGWWRQRQRLRFCFYVCSPIPYIFPCDSVCTCLTWVFNAKRYFILSPRHLCMQ